VTRRAVADERDSVSRARLPAAIGWLAVAPPVVSAAARVARLDESSSLLILADGLTPLLVPPALLALGIGLRQRRWTLAVLSGATAGAFLWSTIPAIGVPAHVPPPGGTPPALRLFNANLHAANPAVAPIAEEIRAAAPDLVTLQEVDPDGAAGLLRSGVAARFPYRVTEVRYGASGIALWSRFPLAESQVLDLGGMPFIRATVVLGARRLRFYTFHVVAPVGEDRARWKAQLRGIDEELRRERRPLVVAGDFNATRHHPSFRRLLSHRLADAHEQRGRGWATTWPRDRWPLPPLMRLDHVLVTPEVTVQSVREGVGRGSDHRPIVADLVLR
jgi:endonuclease/exonuclease/phosphatase family metal-dependent hydrolase